MQAAEWSLWIEPRTGDPTIPLSGRTARVSSKHSSRQIDTHPRRVVSAAWARRAPTSQSGAPYE